MSVIPYIVRPPTKNREWKEDTPKIEMQVESKERNCDKGNKLVVCGVSVCSIWLY